MRILYLCHRIPYPPDKGEKIRAFHELRALSEGHEVDVFTPADDPADAAHAPALGRYCASVTAIRIRPAIARLRSLPHLLSRNPLSLPYFYSGKLRNQIRRALSRRSYDRLFVYSSAMGQYAEDVAGIPMVTDFVDVDSDKWTQYASQTGPPLSLVYQREAWTLRAYERRLSELSARVLVSTEREADLLGEIAPGRRPDVVPNGVDAAYFSPAAVPPASGPPTVIFTGDMSYLPNVDAVVRFAREVLPALRERMREVRFLIVGRRPVKKVRRLGAMEGVSVTGFVPDIRDYLCRAQVAVAPFAISAGIPNKILEALAYGLPVVATSRGLQGLCPGLRGLLDPADTPGEMAARIEFLLRNPQTARRQGAEARDFVIREYRWETAMNRMLDIVRNPFEGGPDEAQTAAGKVSAEDGWARSSR